jgi:hypothetical protein
MSKSEFLVGCDPEVFILNAQGEPVSAAGIIPGSKEEPYKVDGGSVHPDGMAAEFGIDPAKNSSQFIGRVSSVMEQLRSMLPEGHSLSIVPFVRFSPEQFGEAPDEAKELGCNPDFDAYTGEMNVIPDMMEDPFLRTASGHVHVGFPDGPYELNDEQHIRTCRDFVQQLDWFLGAWSCRFDKDPTRRKLYGKAGAFRPKTYGVEYRVMSNFWLTSTSRMAEVFSRTHVAIRTMRTLYLPEFLEKGETAELRQQINNSKITRAFEQRHRSPLVSINSFM